MVRKRNSVERLKHELFPTELAGQWDRLAETSYEKLPEEDIRTAEKRMEFHSRRLEGRKR